MAHIALVYNPLSGGSSHIGLVSKLISENKFSHFELVELDTRNPEKCIHKLVDAQYSTIVALGGDGTVSAIIGAILSLEVDVKFGVLPLGTFNHFAKDIGMPFEISEALIVLDKGNSTYVDVGKVNETYFVNNSSLGLYPKIVSYRDDLQKKGWRKSLAFCLAALAVLRTDTKLTINFETNNKKISKKTPFVFVGNNKYEMEGFNIGERKHLNQGLLSLYLAHNVSKIRLLFLGFHAMKRTLLAQDDFNGIGLRECTITSKRKILAVSHDGEISKMKTPLQYKILPKVLRVIIP